MDIERNPESPIRDRFLPGGDSRAVILIVDDDPDTLAIFRLYLATRDFEIMTAASAAEALQSVDKRLPDLILTDYSMPAASGLEFCRVLRSRGDTRHIPIILHTAADLPVELRQLYDRVFSKPVELDELVTALRMLVITARATSRGG